jgi:hypothetical protein
VKHPAISDRSAVASRPGSVRRRFTAIRRRPSASTASARQHTTPAQLGQNWISSDAGMSARTYVATGPWIVIRSPS